eukprot:scaffold25182_cov62-Phaeocystis_antarctica.AAC.6
MRCSTDGKCRDIGRSSLPGMPALPPMRSRSVGTAGVATDCDAQGLKAQAGVEGCARHVAATEPLAVIHNAVATPRVLDVERHEA